VLGRRIDLLVPEGVEGRVALVPMKDRSVAVAWGQPLVELELEPGAGDRRAASRSRRHAVDRTLAGGAASGIAPARTAPASGIASAGAPDLRNGEHALRAPTTGVFYLRPDPSSPPFAPTGSTLETGQTAGLIEVMKCFSPIVHPGGVIPSPAIVERVSASEGEEVHPGQILFVLRSV
jgi:acetyl-CoA carboxylase biotin carboxyl carrier protein